MKTLLAHEIITSKKIHVIPLAENVFVQGRIYASVRHDDIFILCQLISLIISTRQNKGQNTMEFCTIVLDDSNALEYFATVTCKTHVARNR